MSQLLPIIRRQRRPLVIQPEPVAPASITLDPILPAVPVAVVVPQAPVEISKPKKSRDDAPKN